MAFNVRKYKIGVRRLGQSKSKGARVQLIAQKRIVVNGKKVTVGSKGDLRNPKLLYARASIKKPVVSASTIKGGINPKNVNLKTKKWRKTVQAGGR